MRLGASVYYCCLAMEEIRFCYRCASPMEPQSRDGRVRPVCTRCGTVFFLDPKVVAGVITEVDGNVVMIRRNLEPGLGKWAFPAGFVDRGEVIAEAAVREVKEETGLDVEITRLVGVYSMAGDTNILVVYAGKVVGGELMAGSEAQDVGLYPWESLPPLAFERDAGIIRQWRERRGDDVPDLPQLPTNG